MRAARATPPPGQRQLRPGPDPARWRRQVRLLLAVRGSGIVVLAAGAGYLALRHGWPAAAFCLALMIVNIFVTYKVLKRVRVIEGRGTKIE